jgi:hypothetical protein
MDKLPFVASIIIKNVTTEYGIEQINPENIPLKFNNLLAMKPQINAPDKTDIIKYRLMNFDISGDLDSIYEKKIDKKIEIKIPIVDGINIPTKVLTGVLSSMRFFVLFFTIKNPSHSLKNMRGNLFL